MSRGYVIALCGPTARAGAHQRKVLDPMPVQTQQRLYIRKDDVAVWEAAMVHAARARISLSEYVAQVLRAHVEEIAISRNGES